MICGIEFDPFRVGVSGRFSPWALPTAINFVPSGTLITGFALARLSKKSPTPNSTLDFEETEYCLGAVLARLPINWQSAIGNYLEIKFPSASYKVTSPNGVT